MSPAKQSSGQSISISDVAFAIEESLMCNSGIVEVLGAFT